MKNKKLFAVAAALLAALLYGMNLPLSKLILQSAPPTLTAAFLYLGAGVGVGILTAFRAKKEPAGQNLQKSDLPFLLFMVLLDIAAPILLMWGIRAGSASSSSLLGNFEVVATAVFALLLFREKISPKLWCAIGLITVSGVLLSLGQKEGVLLSPSALLVLGATLCWGLENNCTGKLSGKSAFQIVTVKGIFSGLGSLAVGFFSGESLPCLSLLLKMLLLGFFSYGLSILLYVTSQKFLGAAKTGAYYAVSPFLGAGLSFLILGEAFTPFFALAAALMVLGSFFAVWDTFGHKKEAASMSSDEAKNEKENP